MSRLLVRFRLGAQNKNIIYEIKGLQDINYINKQNYNKDVKFLFKNDIQPYIDYVQNKYGQNFTDLYDKKDKI